MRIWTLHPKYLDASGLTALWRETLLARKVLEGKTTGYKNHPQLNRFRQTDNPPEVINQYLSEVYSESVRRNYNFDRQKVDWSFPESKLPVTTGQLDFEVQHLLNKLKVRDANKYRELMAESVIEIHPLFFLVNGDIEEWERLPGE